MHKLLSFVLRSSTYVLHVYSHLRVNHGNAPSCILVLNLWCIAYDTHLIWPSIVVVLGMHRNLLGPLYWVFRVFVKEADVRSLMLQLFFDDVKEVLGAPELPSRRPLCNICIIQRFGCITDGKLTCLVHFGVITVKGDVVAVVPHSCFCLPLSDLTHL